MFGDDEKSTLERASEAWNDPNLLTPEPPPAAEEPAKPAEGEKPAEAKPAEGVKPAEGAKPGEGEKPAEQKPPALDEKVIKESPAYKTLEADAAGTQKVLDEFKGLLGEFTPWKLDSPDMVRGVFKDATLLYSIMQGKENPGTLIDLALANKDWTQLQKDTLLHNLADYLEKKGFKKGDLDPNDPTQRELLEVRQERAERTQREQQAERVATQQKTSVAIADSLEKLAKEKAIHADDVADYVLVVGNQLRREVDAELQKLGAAGDLSKSKILADLEAGKFALVERLFTEHHNRELARQKRWLDAKHDAKGDRERNLPKTGAAANGAPPLEKKDEKDYTPADLRTADGRIGAATRFWNKDK